MRYKISLDDYQTLHEALVGFIRVGHPDVDTTTHSLKHPRLGLVNMNQPFTLTGIEPNAVLDVVEGGTGVDAPAMVKVALQAESGKRFEADCPSSATLWEVLEEAAKENNVNLLELADLQGNWFIPCLSLERREFAGVEPLCNTTLRQLGFEKGRVLFRLKHRPSIPAQSLAQIQQQVKEQTEKRKAQAVQRAKAQAEAAKAREAEKKRVEDARAQRREDEKARQVPAEKRDALVKALRGLSTEATGEDLKTALATLTTITNNLLQSQDAKFRTLNLASEALTKRMSRFSNAVEYLRALGFTDKADEKGKVQLLPAAESAELLNLAADLLASGGGQASTPRHVLSPRAEIPVAQVVEGRSVTFSGNLLQAQQLTPRSSATNDSAPAPMDTSAESKEEIVSPRLGPDLSGDYNIGDVRKYLTQLEKEVNDRFKLMDTLNLLAKITENLTHEPEKEQYRSIKLKNAKIDSLIVRFPGALSYLTFLGFTKKSGDGSSLSLDKTDVRKFDRAFTVLKTVIKEKQPSEDEYWLSTLGPIERKLKVYSFTDAKSLQAKSEEVPDDDMSSADEKLVLKDYLMEQKRNKELYGPEGTIVFKKQREEMLLKKRERKYDATLVRVEFSDKVLIQAYFRPNETVEDVCKFLQANMKDKSAEFYLLLPPATRLGAENKTKTLKSLGMVPSAHTKFKFVKDNQSTAAGDVLASDIASKKEPFTGVDEVPKAVNKQDLDELDKKELEAQMKVAGGSERKAAPAYKPGGGQASGRALGSSASASKGKVTGADFMRALQGQRASRAALSPTNAGTGTAQA